MRFPTTIIAGIMLLPACAQSRIAPEVLLLSRIRRQAAADLEHLPNFTCLETIERSTRSSPLKPFDVKDVVQVEVAHVGTRELFAWPGASNFENRSLGEMVRGGLTSSGEFASHANSVFVGGAAIIHYAGEEEIGGHTAAHYIYEISPQFSGYAVNIGTQRAAIGAQGSFWADSKTLDLMRLTVEGVQIPEDFHIRATLADIEYGRLQIGSGEFLLPLSARVWIGHDSGTESRNRVEFTHCRQYSTESVVSFAEPKESSEPASNIPVEFVIPPNLTISLRLDSPINMAAAKIGDAVSAIMDADLKHNRKLIAPQGSVVSGRLRLLQKHDDRRLAGIEFTSLKFENHYARFMAKLVSVDSKYVHSSTGSRLADLPPQLPGVATFFIAPGVTELPKGMLMEWKTMGLGK